VKNATEYLARVKALILVCPDVVHSETVREEAEGDMGLFRYRLRLQDDSLLAVFERFEDEMRCTFQRSNVPTCQRSNVLTFQRSNVQRVNVQTRIPPLSAAGVRGP